MVRLIYLSLYQFGGVVDSDDKLVCVWWGGGKGGFIDAHFDVNSLIIYFMPVFTTVVFTTSFAYII